MVSLEITPGISLVTSVKNREQSLRKSLPSWLANKAVDEVIILDWDSEISLQNYINEINSDKIIYIRVENQKFYYITLSTNLAARFATKDKLLFLNSDIILKENFFSEHILRKGVFYTGNWRLARNENETHLNGQFYLYRSDFFAVNGYDERLKSYGWDDTDLYHRLSVNKFLLNKAKFFLPKIFWNLPKLGGLKRLDIHPDTLEHIPHDDQIRTVCYPGFSPSPKISIQSNRTIAFSRAPWSQSFKQAQYEIAQEGAKSFKAIQLDSNFFAVKPVNGLGNRIRVLASCWLVSEILGKKLYVCWTKSSGFSDEAFESLFAANFEFISEQTYRRMEQNPENIVINQRIEQDTEYDTLESGGYRDLNFWTKQIDQANLLYEWSNSLDHVSRGEIKKHKALKDFDRLFAEKLKLLRPAESIASQVVDFAQKNFRNKRVLGVHIRKGDAVESPWAKEYTASTDEEFVSRMKLEIEKDRNVRFFLSTDCPRTLNKFKDLYSDRLIVYEKQFVESKFGTEKANQSDAFVEMLLLSLTKKIVGTRWSTFSEMASKIGDVELEICNSSSGK